MKIFKYNPNSGKIKPKSIKVDDIVYDKLKSLKASLYINNAKNDYIVSIKTGHKEYRNVSLKRFVLECYQEDLIRNVPIFLLDESSDNYCLENLRLGKKGDYFTSKGFLGVEKCGNKYKAILYKFSNITLFGIYDTPLEAAIAYDKGIIAMNIDRLILNKVIVDKETYESMYHKVDYFLLGGEVSINKYIQSIGLSKPAPTKENRFLGVTKIQGAFGAIRYRVKIKYKNLDLYIGAYKNEEVAARVYNQLALFILGEEAKLNNIEYRSEIERTPITGKELKDIVTRLQTVLENRNIKLDKELKEKMNNVLKSKVPKELEESEVIDLLVETIFGT